MFNFRFKEKLLLVEAREANVLVRMSHSCEEERESGGDCDFGIGGGMRRG